MTASTGSNGSRLRVGVVGAGPWAQFVHAPMFAGHAATELVAVWARRPEAASALAAAHGAAAYSGTLGDGTGWDAFLDGCDAVAFAVPPDVQAAMATRAAMAGKAVLLEKPLALDVAGAERLVDAIGEAGVGSQVVLTWRYTDAVRAFLGAAAGLDLVGGRGWFILGSLLGGPFATPWRLEHGVLLDLGPHVVDTLDAALGAVVGVRAHGSARWVGLLLEHDSGARSEVSLSGHVGIEQFRVGAEVCSESEVLEVDVANAAGPATFTSIAGEFVATASGTPHPLDAQRGLHLQRILANAAAQL